MLDAQTIAEPAAQFLARVRRTHSPLDSLSDLRRIERMAYDGDLIHVDEIADHLRHLASLGIDLPQGVHLAEGMGA